jgi:pimeloyl-ACP methyl ester carboxylesterase
VSTKAGQLHGGAIALQFALDAPARVGKIVIANAGVPASGVSLTQLLGMLWMNLVPSSTVSHWLRRYAVVDQTTIDPALGEYEAGVCRMRGGRRAFWRGRGRAGAPLPLECLERIQQETLIIWGQEDPFFPAASAEAMRTAMPRAQLHIVPEAGHLPFFDQPDMFADYIVRFMSRERCLDGLPPNQRIQQTASEGLG